MVPEPLRPDEAAGRAPGERPRRKLPRVPGYRLEGILGSGATGVVYRARQLSVDRPVALKILNPELTRPLPAGQEEPGEPGESGRGTRTRAARRLQREARTAARLAHPNVISAIDMGEVDGTWWYAMELVEGESLAQRLKRGPIAERDALKLFIPLCEALVHLADQGVVHRDIKPGNILLDHHGRARLVDLGLAFSDDDPSLTQPGGTLGTPHYISPEQARDPSRVGAASDLWSFGATLFHAVTGRTPFTGRSVAEILTAVLYARVPDPNELAPNLSRGMGLVLRKCLQRNRASRYADPAALLADLELVLERRAPLVSRRGLEPVARKKRVLGLWLAATAATIAVVAALSMLPSDDPGVSEPSVTAEAEWPRLEELRARAASDPARLAGAFEDLIAMREARAFPTSATMHFHTVYDDLYGRLERELWHLQRSIDDELTKLIEERAFPVAELLVAGGVSERLAERTGYTPERLPGRCGPTFDAWAGRLRETVSSTSRAAERELVAALDGELARVLPLVERFEAEQRWKDARELLPLTAERWLAASKADARGLDEARVDDRLQGLMGRVRVRRAALERAWREQDRELLGWVQERVAELERGLAEHTVVHAADVLEREWLARLERLGLVVEQMPENVRLALETCDAAVTRLERLGRELRLSTARDGYRGLERELEPLWGERRYARIAERLRERQGDAALEPVRAEVLLRAREAELLADVLRSAAAALTRRAGETVELRVGSLGVLRGKIEVSGDPLERGFVLRPRDAGRLPFALLVGSEAPAKATLLATSALEELAGLPLDPASGGRADERLVRALFRLREGDPEGARRVFEGEPMPLGDPLVEDLRERLDSALRVRRSDDATRASEAQRKLELLRRERQLGARTRRGYADDLLRDFADVLSAEELAEVRALRRELEREGPASLDELAALFRPDVGPVSVGNVGSAGSGRVRMGFQFDKSAAGAWEPGAWVPDGRGWTRGKAARSDADLVARPSPRLLLREPLSIEDTLQVELVIEEPDDVDPELLVISVAGFHIALHTPRTGPARCLIGTGDALAVVRDARAGGGKRFAGLDRGQPFTLVLRLNQARGTVDVTLDGVEIARTLLPSPRGESGSASLVVRAYEPVRLVAVTIEAARR